MKESAKNVSLEHAEKMISYNHASCLAYIWTCVSVCMYRD